MSVLREIERELNKRRQKMKKGDDDGCGCLFVSLILAALALIKWWLSK